MEAVRVPRSLSEGQKREKMQFLALRCATNTFMLSCYEILRSFTPSAKP